MALVVNYEAAIANLVTQRNVLTAEIGRIDEILQALRSGGDTFLPITTPKPSLLPAKESFSLTPASKGEISNANRKAPIPPPPSQPNHGELPNGANTSWVSIVAADASPYALALAVLKAHEGSISSAQLNTAIGDIRGIKGGVGYTVLEPLQKAGVIRGSNAAWEILDRSQGGIIAGKFLWCQPKYLNIYDWAAVRREALVILLSEHPGSTIAAMAKSLLSCQWLKAPVSPHLVKADLRTLEKDRIAVQDYATRTWKVIERID